MNADLSPTVKVTAGDDPPFHITLASFLQANADGIDPEQAREIGAAIARGEAWTGGGGAAPVFEVAPTASADFTVIAPASSEPRSGLTRGPDLPTAIPAADPVYLLHSSPLRACVVALGPTAGPDASSVEACRYGPNRLPRVLCRLGGAWFPLSAEEARTEARHLLVNDGGPTDPASELANHVAGGLIAAADTLDAALAAERDQVLAAGRAA